jgi:hypothetical protein
MDIQSAKDYTLLTDYQSQRVFAVGKDKKAKTPSVEERMKELRAREAAAHEDVAKLHPALQLLLYRLTDPYRKIPKHKSDKEFEEMIRRGEDPYAGMPKATRLEEIFCGPRTPREVLKKLADTKLTEG